MLERQGMIIRFPLALLLLQWHAEGPTLSNLGDEPTSCMISDDRGILLLRFVNLSNIRTSIQARTCIGIRT